MVCEQLEDAVADAPWRRYALEGQLMPARHQDLSYRFVVACRYHARLFRAAHTLRARPLPVAVSVRCKERDVRLRIGAVLAIFDPGLHPQGLQDAIIGRGLQEGHRFPARDLV